MEAQLPAFKEKNPQLEVITELIRGQHPHLKGVYSELTSLFINVVWRTLNFCWGIAENHNERVVCVKNLKPDDILLQATRLRNSLGRKVVKLRTRHVTKHPSVQGTWSTALKFDT